VIPSSLSTVPAEADGTGPVGSGGVRPYRALSVVSEERGAHLGAARVVDADGQRGVRQALAISR
jgi:hypothetical protein